MRPKLLLSDISSILNCSTPQAYRILQSKKIDHFVENRKSFICHKESKKLFNFKIKNKIFHFYTPKGGVGKTTVSREFSICASILGLKVLCIDLDQQSNLTSSLGLIPENQSSISEIIQKKVSAKDAIKNIMDGVDLLPSNDENTFVDDYIISGRVNINKLFKKEIGDITNNYDIIVLDSPPSHSRLVVAANLFSDVLVIPIVPDDFSINSLINFIKKIKNYTSEFEKKITFKIFLNNYDARKSKSIEVLSGIMSSRYKKNLVLSTIGTTTTFINSRDEKKSIFDSTTKHIRKACTDILELTQDILEIKNADS